jgi:hypothetical protein
MITPQRLLETLRAELATRVLPELTDDRARSSVIAALGLLKDLAPRVHLDEAWLAESVALLEPAAQRWRARLPDPLATELDPRRGADGAPGHRRDWLLAGAERLIEYLWRTGSDPDLLQDIRSVLRADVELEIKRLA